MKHITSRQNSVVSRYKAVARGEEPTGLLLDGHHLVGEALASGLAVRHAVVGTQGLERGDIRALLKRLERQGAEIAVATAPVMAAVSPVRSSSIIVALVGRPTDDAGRLYAGKTPNVVIACDVQNPGNLGAIARVVWAGGASGLVAAGRCADPFGWKALRGSMGTALRLPIAVRAGVDQAVTEARQHGARIAATVPRGGHPLFEVDLRGPLAILVGGEGAGLPQSLVDQADERVTIPMQPPVESLNTAVTAALMIYEAFRQRQKQEG